MEMRQPAAQEFAGCRRQFAPRHGQLPIVEGSCQIIQTSTHSNNTCQGTLQILESSHHAFHQIVPALQLLKQHNLGGHQVARRVLGLLCLEDGLSIKRCWDLARKVVHDALEHSFTRITASVTTASSGLQFKEIHPQLLRCIRQIPNFGVGMQTKDLRTVLHRHVLDLLRVHVAVDRAVVLVRVGELVIHLLIEIEVEGLEGIEQEITHVLLEVSHHNPPVHAVGHAPPIHALPHKVPQGGPRDGPIVVEGFGKVSVCQFSRRHKIGLVVIIDHVPSNGAVFPALLHHRMEESQHKHKWPEGKVWAGFQ
mmetsp:Transcript_3414/g.6492  ORF Transcript_3414/g.6492 Transcript_3414/m.6492 type:complete len:309 (-) Transcript_3414:6974-7900(-)